MTDETMKEAIAEVWALFKETDAKFKETDARFKETDAKLDKRFAETDARLDKRFAETDARLDKRFAQTDSKINKLEGLFGSQWGKLIETLVQSNALNLFQKRGIQVHYVYQRAKSKHNGQNMEIDIILENDIEIIVVEVKTTLKIADVQDFLDDLAEFTTFFPKYKNHRIYGAVAGLDIAENADRYAYKRGLFVMGVVGEGLAEIKNDEQFKPRDFAISN